MNFCTKCGRELEGRVRPTGRFDSLSGAPTEYQWLVCPEWRRRLLFDTGHTWHFRGVNRIDGGGRPDPGHVENPPHPPA